MRHPLCPRGTRGLLKDDTCVLHGRPPGLLVTRTNCIYRLYHASIQVRIRHLRGNQGPLRIVFKGDVRATWRGLFCRASAHCPVQRVNCPPTRVGRREVTHLFNVCVRPAGLTSERVRGDFYDGELGGSCSRLRRPHELSVKVTRHLPTSREEKLRPAFNRQGRLTPPIGSRLSTPRKRHPFKCQYGHVITRRPMVPSVEGRYLYKLCSSR